jgi:uncharacterized protein (UPF0262 family)/protein-tyrosine-phosphatase
MRNPRDLDGKTDKIVAITLDPNTITSIDPDEVHEWRIAIYDLVEQNLFRPARVKDKGPFALHVSIIGNWIVLDVRHPETYEPIAAHYLSLTPFRRLIRDYFRIRDSYYEAIKTSTPFQIEAVDMARRGLHNEAAELLRSRLDNKLEMDLNTARRLFTRICAVQPVARRIDERESDLPTVLFVCSMNSVRSPMAAALARKQFPGRLIVRSAGVRSGRADSFAHEVMEEIEERHIETARGEHWPMPDPTTVEGNREAVLSAYRTLRDMLHKRVREGLEPLVAGGSQSS